MKAIDLRGRKIGKWLVLERRPKGKWLCRCECGTVKEVNGGNLRKGVSTCCGCNRVAIAKNNFTKHGHSNTKLYQTWATIKARCYRPTHIEYPRYGARGISMYSEWINDYSAFEEYVLSTIGQKPSREFSMDRIDNTLGYVPGNLKWSTMQEQSNNRRSNHLITYNGMTKTLQQWANSLGIEHYTLLGRLRRFSLEEAMKNCEQENDNE